MQLLSSPHTSPATAAALPTLSLHTAPPSGRPLVQCSRTVLLVRDLGTAAGTSQQSKENDQRSDGPATAAGRVNVLGTSEDRG